MTVQENDTLREVISQARITFAGAGAKIKLMSGTQPAAGGSETTVLATLTFGSAIGTSSGGVLTLGSFTQTNGDHVNGTPTWMRVCKSDNTWIWDAAIPADATFTGTVATGVDIAPGTLTVTAGG